MKRSWDKDKKLRPNFVELKNELEKILKDCNDNEKLIIV